MKLIKILAFLSTGLAITAGPAAASRDGEVAGGASSSIAAGTSPANAAGWGIVTARSIACWARPIQRRCTPACRACSRAGRKR